MEGDNRPSQEDMDMCQKGISIRNDYMHMKTDKSGNYNVEKHDDISLTECVVALSRTLNCFTRELEKIRSS